MAPSVTKKAEAARDLRQRILTCVSKLSDRDTNAQAVSELESIITTLTPDTFSLFINSLSSTAATAARSAARSAALRLLSSLSSSHGRSLSPHLPKLIAVVLRRLRDPDSAVRSSTADAVASFSSHTAKPSTFFSSIVRPLSDSLSTEQELSAQSTAGLCLSAAIDASPYHDAFQISKLLPKWMKLLKCEGFKAKSAMLVLIRSAIKVSEVGNCDLLRDLVICIVEFLKSEDWAARKAAAEVLAEIAVVERDSLSELKASCLKIFESRRFDKVKAVREAMNQMVEVWKDIPDVFDDGSSPPPRSSASSRENASDGRCPARPKISSAVDSNTPQTRRKLIPLRRSSPSDSALKATARNSSALDVTGKRTSPPIFRKLNGSSVTSGLEDSPQGDDEGVPTRAGFRSSKPGIKRGLFSKNPGSRVMPCPDDDSEATVVVRNTSADLCRHHKDSEDLSEIRKQLVLIENQQSSLMDLLQKFIDGTQDGMHSLETRVHGLEMALDNISYDLAVSTARMSTTEPTRTKGCLLAGSGFLSSKFWRRPDNRFSTSRFSFTGSTPLVSTVHDINGKNPACLENRRFQLRGAGGVIVNPLAEIHGESRATSKASSSGVFRSVHNGA